jgi:hypothetical protein
MKEDVIMIVELDRKTINDSNFTLPSQWNKEGIRIKRVIIDKNIVPNTLYYMMGPRTIHLENYTNGVKVYAEL